jgi:hypothetical protein
MESYPAMKKNEILSFVSKWMELESIILSKVSQAQKTNNHILSFMCGLYILGKYRNVVGLGSHDKGRAHTGGMGIGTIPKHDCIWCLQCRVTNTETLKQ